jgi:hypothetical protein
MMLVERVAPFPLQSPGQPAGHEIANESSHFALRPIARRRTCLAAAAAFAGPRRAAGPVGREAVE